MTVRPYGVIIDGALELGLELVIEGGRIEEIRPHTGIPEAFVVSPAFVNAHSHLEYRGMLGAIQELEYWPWIREITRLKLNQSEAQVRLDCEQAAAENRDGGVAMIGEHSDRPFAGTAMAGWELGGVIFQEVITFNEREDRVAKLKLIEERASKNRSVFEPVYSSPHAYYTVDRQTLREIGAAGDPVSIHVAETQLETEFTKEGTGQIAEFYRSAGVPFEPTCKGIVESLADLGLVRPNAQFVHCCAVSEAEIGLMSEHGVKVAHCPRSNSRLHCPPAPVREMLDAGIQVGLGMDSVASSGPIDMFEEMRAALYTSIERGKPLKAEEVWRMATRPESLPIETPCWRVCNGSEAPLIKIHLGAALSAIDVIERGTPELVEWVCP